MTAVVEKRSVSVTLPCKIEGPFRIQYPSRRDGNYFWISYRISSAARDSNDQENVKIIVENGTAVSVATLIEDLD